MKMKVALLLSFLGCAVLAVAQGKPATKSAAQHATVSQVMDRQFSGVEKEFVDAADAMPEDKYNFAPSDGEFKGVRTFAQQVKHVAAVNYLIFSDMLGEKPPANVGGENGPDSMTSKADIMKFLRDSFALGHRAYAAITPQNEVAPIKNPFGGKQPATRLGLGTLIVGHCFDHYGQMVEYLRMNGIIPPASRPQPKK
ncbi:MAG TPA: DinB family protein [Terriglobales bacterium]|nr:DinB family protein [Terriglobales bacterium]